MATINSTGRERELSDAFRKLTFLPASAAVKGPMVQAQPILALQFTDDDHERSRTVREVLDSFAFDALAKYGAPKPAPQLPHESIVMDGKSILNTISIAGKIIRQHRHAAIEVDPELLLIAAEAAGRLPDVRLAQLAKESDRLLDAALKRLAADSIHDGRKRKAPIRRSLLARIFGLILIPAAASRS